MPIKCSDCGHQMLLSPDGATTTVSCEKCGGKRLEVDQPSPTHSDGDLRNMVDPSTGMDQGGNPNMEGIWANNGWQNYQKRDESFASVRTSMDDLGGFDFESEPNYPTHHVIVDPYGGVYSGQYPETHESIADRHRIEDHNGLSKGGVFPDGTTEWYSHASGHSPQAMEQMLHGHFGTPIQVDPNLQGSNENERWGLNPGPAQSELQTLESPPRARSYGVPLDRNEGLVRGGGYERTSNMEPYDSWMFESAAEPIVEEAPAETIPVEGQQVPAYSQEGVVPGPYGIHAGTTKWLKFLHAHVNGVPVRDNIEQIIREHGNPNAPGFGQPVTVSAFHPEHLAAAVDVINHSSTGGQPSPKMIEVGRAIQRGEMEPPPGISSANFKPRQARMIYKAFGFGTLLGLGEAGAGLALAPETGGASLGLLGAAAPQLMKGALMGVGSHAVQGLMGQQDGSGQQPSMPPGPRDLGSIAKVADMETPHTTPVLHDNPDGDTKQFQDGAESPGNLEHPGTSGEAGGAAVGEDNVPPSFGQNSPAMERFNLLFPAVMHYYHSDQSGAQDPMIHELHQMMEKEVPGYLDHPGDLPDEQGNMAVQNLIKHLREHPGVHAKVAAPGFIQDVKDTIIDPLHGEYRNQERAPYHQPNPSEENLNVLRRYHELVGQGVAPAAAMTMAKGESGHTGKTAMQPGWNMSPGSAPMTQPGAPTTAIDPNAVQGPTPGATHCAFCGAVTDPASGTCPQCGAQNNPHAMGMQQGTPQAVQGPSPATPFVGKTAADTQGPVSPEQIAAVQQLLIDSGRVQEVPNVPIHPENYARELAQVTQQDPTVAPTVDPSQQPPPPPMDPSQMQGQMPMPGMSVPGGPGGGGPPMQSKVASPHAGAPRCPKCGSATTGFINSLDGKASGDCHSCGNVWPIEDAEVIKTSVELQPSFHNPAGVPEPDQQHPYDPEQDQDSTHLWQDADGDPLQPGSEYELFTPGVSIPDRIRIDKTKPDELLYSTIGEFSPDPTGAEPLTYQSRITKEDMDLRGYQFQKADDQNSDAGEQNLDEYQNTSQAPVNTEPSAVGGIQPRGAVREIDGPDDTHCPKCSSTHISAEMSSPTTTFHECYRCSHGWETQEEEFEADGAQTRAWIQSSGGNDDDFWQGMERAREMQEAGVGSRSLAAAAARDTRADAIRERLESNKTEREQRLAGKKFTPREQRALIDERGIARNADQLDLEGTHYESHRYLGDRANGENVRDEDLFLGL